MYASGSAQYGNGCDGGRSGVELLESVEAEADDGIDRGRCA